MNNQNVNRTANQSENAVARIMGMLKAVIEGQKSLEENQKKLQETCEHLTISMKEMKERMTSNQQFLLSSSGRQLAPPSIFENGITMLMESLNEDRVMELLKEPDTNGERDIDTPQIKGQKNKILYLLRSNLNSYREVYLQDLENGTITRSPDHDKILAVTPMVQIAYKNLLSITSIFVSNNILCNYPKGIRWNDFSSLEKLKYALCLEDILFKSGYPGVTLHPAKNSWASKSMLSEKLRGISKEQPRNITNAASTNEQLSTTIVVESLSNETQRGEQNEMTQSLLSSAEEDAMGSFYSTQDSQMLVDLLATDLSSGQKRTNDVNLVSRASKRITRYESFMDE